MDLSPNDIRNFEFPTQMRGYDKDEVDSLLDQAADALEKSKEQNMKLSMENESIKTQYNGLKQFEDTIKSAAIDARRNADNTVADAKKEAEEILNKAKGDAEQSVTDNAQELARLEIQISELKVTKKSYFLKIQTLIQSHLSMIEEVNNSEIEDQLEITDSEDIKQNRSEMGIDHKFDVGVNVSEQATDSTLTESSKNKLTDVLKDVLSQYDSKEQNAASVDPELAAALQGYKHPDVTSNSETSESNDTGKMDSEEFAVPGMVETTTRADDVPDGFVTKDNNVVISPDTSEISTNDNSDTGQLEHNTIDPNMALNQKDQSTKPEELAHELDEVVAKFEEEMDKAEKS